MADYERKGNMGSFAAGLLGAVIGAVGSAAAIFLSNKENRQKAQRKFENLKDKGMKAFHDIKRKATDLAEETEKQVEKGKKEIAKKRSEKNS